MDEDKELKPGIIGRIRRDFGFRLKIVSYAVVTAVAIIVVATVVMSVLVWLSSTSLADRLAGIGAIFGGMSLLLTVFAAVVAYLAFWVSIGVPDLKLQVRFGPSSPNQLAITAKRQNGWPENRRAGDAWPESGWLEAKDPAETAVVICFRNFGTYAAKAPAVIVQLEGMEFADDVLALNAAGWAVNERSETGIRVVQWEGGADHSVYTNLVRELPYSISRACVRSRVGRAAGRGLFSSLRISCRIHGLWFPFLRTFSGEIPGSQSTLRWTGSLSSRRERNLQNGSERKMYRADKFSQELRHILASLLTPMAY